MKCCIQLLPAVLVVGLAVAAGCGKQRPDSQSAPPDPKSALRTAGARTFTSFDPPTPGEKHIPAQSINFEQADLSQVLKLYAETSGRSIIRAGDLPNVKISFFNQTPMTAVELLQALDTVFAAQRLAMVYLGTQYVKVVPEAVAHMEAGPVVELQPDQLPDSGSYLIYVVKLKKVSTTQAVAALQPFAKLPNSILAIPAGAKPPAMAGLPNLSTIIGKNQPILVLRDYSSNVRRMLQVVEKMEQQ